MGVRTSSFPTAQARDAALDVFRSRGFKVRRPGAVFLWPGEIQAASDRQGEPALRWRSLDDDPAAPFWELLQALHKREDGERLGFALTMLVDRGLTPREVCDALEASWPS